MEDWKKSVRLKGFGMLYGLIRRRFWGGGEEERVDLFATKEKGEEWMKKNTEMKAGGWWITKEWCYRLEEIDLFKP